ncbi:MAG: hypothetical protein RLZ12_785 [Bacillota bacterium]
MLTTLSKKFFLSKLLLLSLTAGYISTGAPITKAAEAAPVVKIPPTPLTEAALNTPPGSPQQQTAIKVEEENLSQITSAPAQTTTAATADTKPPSPPLEAFFFSPLSPNLTDLSALCLPRPSDITKDLAARVTKLEEENKRLSHMFTDLQQMFADLQLALKTIKPPVPTGVCYPKPALPSPPLPLDRISLQQAQQQALCYPYFLPAQNYTATQGLNYLSNIPINNSLPNPDNPVVRSSKRVYRNFDGSSVSLNS